jgi:hypothetical protein
MARATKTSSRNPRATAGDDTPRRGPGRPPGSTNARKPPSAKSAGATKPTARGRASTDAARVPKLNKAELETQVAKLERTVARLRSKNKELKLAANEAREHADMLEAQLTSRSAATSAKPPRQTRRRTGRTSAAASESEESADESSQD